MNGFQKACKLLDKLDAQRSDPSDHLFNIARVMETVKMNEEESVNFYAYICSPDKEDFEYKPRSEYVTLGDLGDEELQRLHNEIYGKNEFNQIIKQVAPTHRV